MVGVVGSSPIAPTKANILIEIRSLSRLKFPTPNAVLSLKSVSFPALYFPDARDYTAQGMKLNFC